MKSTLWLVLAAATAACAQTSREQQIVNDAAAAIGGANRILAVKSLVLEGSGTNGNLGQDVTPDATSQTFQVTGYRRVVDVAGRRSRIDQTRTPNFVYFLGPAPSTQVTGIDGAVGYDIAANGTATRAPKPAAVDRRMEMYHHPLMILRAALEPGSRLENPHSMGHESVLDVTVLGTGKFTLAVDEGTKLPTRVVSMTDNTNLGDVAVETSFGDYQDVSGLKLPAHLTTRTDKYPTADIKLTKQTVDGDASQAAAPAAAASAPETSGIPPSTVKTEEVAKGVWMLAGQTYNSVVVEFADHLLLIESPLNDTQALAMIAAARELRPGKPLTAVVNTHHHFDHSGGVRAAVSEGLTIITHKRNEALYQEVVSRPHTIVPDALAKKPAPLTIETVDGEKTIADAMMSVVLYSIDGGPHADTLLMAYLPKQRLLVEADGYNYNFAFTGNKYPFAANLLDNIKRRNLQVDRIITLHGSVAPFAELTKAVGGTP